MDSELSSRDSGRLEAPKTENCLRFTTHGNGLVAGYLPVNSQVAHVTGRLSAHWIARRRY